MKNHAGTSAPTANQQGPMANVLWHTLEPGSFIRGIGMGIMIGGGLGAKYGIGLAVPLLLGSALIPLGHVVTRLYLARTV